MNIQVSLQTDADGFLSQECPACGKRFKVVYGDGSNKPVSYCPYCGHEGQDCWWTQEQAEYFEGVASEEVVRPMLDDFARNIDRMSRPRDFMQMTAKVSHDPPVQVPTEPDENIPMVSFACCGERIKHDGSTGRLHCVICGQVSVGHS